MLTLVAHVDLTHGAGNGGDVDRADRARLADLDGLPNGARVRVSIGGRVWPSTAAVVSLRAHQDRLTVQLEGEARALVNWHAELASGVIG